MKKTLLLLFLVSWFHVSAQDGFLDSTFGNDGIVTTSLAPFGGSAVLIKIQPDNKIVVAGRINTSPNTFDFCIIRYLADGALDPNFGTNGMVTTHFVKSSSISDIALQDGKIIAVGNTYNDSLQSEFAIAKYNDDGTPDDSFGIAGKVTTTVTTTDNASAVAVKILPDGKLLVGGNVQSTVLTDVMYLALTRYLPNGSLDTGFGVGGVITPNGSAVKKMEVLPDSKILILGLGFINYRLSKYNADGTPDTSYGDNGTVAGVNEIGDNLDPYMNGMIVFPNGKTILSGKINDMQNSNSLAFLQLDDTGHFDHSFGTNGAVMYPNNPIYPVNIILQEDNKIVMGAIVYSPSMDFAVIRFNPDGSFDPTFGTNGITQTSITTDNDILYNTAFQNNGKLVAVGISNLGITLTRYTRQTLSTTAFQQNNNVFVYPNPAADILNFNQTVENVKVYDAQGRMITENKLQTNTLNVADLVSGIYFLSYVIDGNKHSQKIIKR